MLSTVSVRIAHENCYEKMETCTCGHSLFQSGEARGLKRFVRGTDCKKVYIHRRRTDPSVLGTPRFVEQGPYPRFQLLPFGQCSAIVVILPAKFLCNLNCLVFNWNWENVGFLRVFSVFYSPPCNRELLTNSLYFLGTRYRFGNSKWQVRRTSSCVGGSPSRSNDSMTASVSCVSL